MSSAEDLNNLGAGCSLRGDMEGARLHYAAALNLNPNLTIALNNLGVLAGKQNDLITGRICFARLAALEPQNGAHWANLGNMLTRLEQFTEADEAFARARALIPDSATMWHAMMIQAQRCGRYVEAIELCDAIASFGLDTPSLQNDRAHILLYLGRLAEAWPLYEARWTMMAHLPPWDFYIPEWKGEALAGKRILFHGEQGFGDTLMCSRFVKNLQDLGAIVTLCVPPGLMTLFTHQDWNCDLLSIEEVPENAHDLFDFHSPMFSAMGHLGVTVESISAKPYLIAPKITSPNIDADFMNVGICWASGKRNTDMDWRRREADLKLWAPLAELPNVRLWSLQKGQNEADIPACGMEGFIRDVTIRLEDWADTAAFMQKLDLIVTVDTAVAHLAGALGKPVIMLSQYTPCWRWWNIESGSGAPWYESMQIIKQPAPGDWGSQVKEVVKLIQSGNVIEQRLAA